MFDRSLDCFWMKVPYERDWFLYFSVSFHRSKKSSFGLHLTLKREF